MPHWLIKSAIHHAISVLPQSQKWNEFLQEKVTKSLELGTGEFEGRLNSCRRCLEDFLETNPAGADGFTALELGTGWYPTVSIGLYLCGASEIWSFDITPLLRRDRFKVLLKYFCEYAEKGLLENFLPRLQADRVSRLRELSTKAETQMPKDLLEQLNIHTWIADARNTGLKPASIDLFFSYSVLEYIPAIVQEGLYQEFRRLAQPRAASIHYINIKDQYCDFDRSIGPLNCLKYSSGAWKWLDSPLIPQTRLRISDYRELFNKNGFEITKETSTRANPAELDKIKLAPEFRKYKTEDLLVVTTWLAATVRT